MPSISGIATIDEMHLLFAKILMVIQFNEYSYLELFLFLNWYLVPYSNCTNGDLSVESTALEETENTTRGRLEICINNVWFSIVHTYSWSRTNSVTASKACHLLGYSDNTGNQVIWCKCCTLLPFIQMPGYTLVISLITLKFLCTHWISAVSLPAQHF